jgi:hypothetical protein
VGEGQFRSENVVLGQALASKLLGLMKSQNIALPCCWVLRSDGSLTLDAGPFCGTKVVARFRELDGEWRLESEDDDPFVMCHERKR